jgi:hypothetical protein
MSKHINHLVNKFKRSLYHDNNKRRKTNKPFYVTDYDILCLNEVVKYFNSTKQNVMNDNVMFGKLFISVFAKEIWRTSSYEMALDHMRRILEVSLESHFHAFRIDMMLFNFDQTYKMLEGPKDLDYSKGITPEQRKKYAEEKTKFFKNNEIDMKKSIISEHWNQEKTKERLNHLISDLIMEYSNK